MQRRFYGPLMGFGCNHVETQNYLHTNHDKSYSILNALCLLMSSKSLTTYQSFNKVAKPLNLF
ncbi:CLUMA_CG004784, isoform A [Clunio marinus]|uniref:CLUMA_CG004784, isoform A n=1 Tax=Clunio marinus TaxID=568069 RepID=A0A1J1HSP7_9DIPT|nr:CLUMA_CG004784, isoform A [Clunio marinus]